MARSVAIVIIDDNAGSLELLATALSREGITVHTALHPAQGLELVREHRPQLVLTDLVMPGMNGLEVLSRVFEIDSTIDVLLMTAHYTTETAVEAIRRGAADYLEKPVRLPLLRERVFRLLEASRKRLQITSAHPAEETGTEDAGFEGIVAKSPRMWTMFGMMQRIAPHYRSVLLHGQTGSGKDLVAGALHRLSGVSGNYVVLNCSAVVETLFESELFGHTKGAFTGADKDKAGLFEHANNGTLFLDEIGDMPLSTQAKLLRAVQNQEVLRIGSLTPRKVNVRIIAATHRDLQTAIREGRFREDLYYRLSSVEIEVPPLSQRKEDIPLLARHFILQLSKQYGKPIHDLAPRTKSILEEYPWPGNVRELENVISHACMMATGELIEISDLPERIQHPGNIVNNGNSEPLAPYPSTGTNQQSDNSTGQDLAAQEQQLILRALHLSNRNQSHAARQLGIGRDALRYKMKKYGII